MFELKRILKFGRAALDKGQGFIIATIVETEGSSYRKTWTQMAIAEDLSYAGNLSGGCVENETLKQANQVFKTRQNLIFEYDGTYRLGCKGIIYVLLELVDKLKFEAIYANIKKADIDRSSFTQGIELLAGDNLKQTYFSFNEDNDKLYFNHSQEKAISKLTRTVKPQKQLIIVGSEFDSDLLSKQALMSGYKVIQIVGLTYKIPEVLKRDIICLEPEQLKSNCILDKRTAILLMNHSFSRDIHFIKELITEEVLYIGSLGPKQRRSDIVDFLFENYSDTQSIILDHIDKIKGPIGLDINAKMPEEIAISILAEMVQLFNA